MKLLRYNQEPVEIDISKIQSITAYTGVFIVQLTTGERHTGYFLS
jgi:hypothetical protein